MLDEYRAQTGVDSSGVNDLIDLPGDFMQSLSCSVDGELSDHGIIMVLCRSCAQLQAKACGIGGALSSIYRGKWSEPGNLDLRRY